MQMPENIDMTLVRLTPNGSAIEGSQDTYRINEQVDA